MYLLVYSAKGNLSLCVVRVHTDIPSPFIGLANDYRFTGSQGRFAYVFAG